MANMEDTEHLPCVEQINDFVPSDVADKIDTPEGAGCGVAPAFGDAIGPHPTTGDRRLGEFR